MSDFGAATPHEEPHDAAHEAVRDALPALLHGRVTASARAELDAHLATCAACRADFATLGAIRDLYTMQSPAAASPAVSVDRIADAVRARTAVRPAEPVPSRPTRVPPRRAPAWARRGTVRAVAASALLAIGSGAMLISRTPRTPAVQGPAASAVALRSDTPAVRATGASGSLLGANFSDLDDGELAAVVAAVDDPASPTPAAEPTPVTPNVLVPDGE